MKEYLSPNMEVVSIDVSDVITFSILGGNEGEDNDVTVAPFNEDIAPDDQL